MKIIIIPILICFSQIAEAQIQTQKNIKIAQKPLVVTNEVAIKEMEVIKVLLPQSPILHDDGGWEKEPTAWAASKKFPVDYRGAALLLDRNGMVRYLSPWILFKSAGSIEVSANSMGTSFIGRHPFKRVYGKKGEVINLSFITTEKEFGKEINIYLKNFEPAKR